MLFCCNYFSYGALYSIGPCGTHYSVSVDFIRSHHIVTPYKGCFYGLIFLLRKSTLIPEIANNYLYFI